MRGTRRRTGFYRIALAALLLASAVAPALARPLDTTKLAADEPSGEQPADSGPDEDSPFGPPVEIPEERVRWLSLTVAPLLLAELFLEVTGELRVGEDLGVAVIAGLGSVKAEEEEGVEAPTDRYKVYELGVQARYYVHGSFTRGVNVGVEAIYLAAYDETGSAILRREGVTVGGFGGYKRVLNGITLDIQLGVEVLAARTSAAQESKAGALININFGYTF